MVLKLDLLEQEYQRIKAPSTLNGGAHRTVLVAKNSVHLCLAIAFDYDIYSSIVEYTLTHQRAMMYIL